MILSAIAAMSRNRVIGKENKLPWHLPEDLKYFKEKTKGKIMIMGRKTFDSIGQRPLPGRLHIVITRNPDYKSKDDLVKIVSSLEQAIALAKTLIGHPYPDEVFVVGGAEIYKQALPLLNRLYLTVIEKDYEGDAFFPEFEQFNYKLVSKDSHTGEIPYSFQIFERK
ncbi:MAG: dihydrofolate reductase [Oligoflexia bacterium]|nr:MAG: dihydrofolate reductase [Oligoflexia bacterium]